MSRPSKPKYFLETSFLLKLFQYSEKDADRILAKLAPGERYAAYYSLIEFNCGMMSVAIHYRSLVLDLKDVSAAEVQISNLFGRGAKYYTLFHAILIRWHSLLDTSDYLIYADLLETAIMRMHERFTAIIKQFIGHYGSHSKAIAKLADSSEFDKIPKPTAKLVRPDLTEVWQDNITTIKKVKNQLELIAMSRKLVQLEREILELTALILKDPSVRISHKHMGDLSIVLDCPISQTLQAHDKVFRYLIPLTKRNGGYIDVSTFKK